MNKRDQLNVLVAPVSGSGFVNQLAIFQHLATCDYVPDIAITASGGAVATYLALAAKWRWNTIQRISRTLTSDLFVKPWSNLSITSFILGYYNGNMFNSGNGSKHCFETWFTKESVQTSEIWTSVYNTSQSKAQLFCNLSNEKSIIDTSYIDKELTNSMNCVYCSGNLPLLAKVTSASAAIPTVVPPVKINGEDYVDGGVAAASGLSILTEPILQYAKIHKKALHITYVNSVDLNCPTNCSSRNLLDNYKSAANNLIKSNLVLDRLSAYLMLRGQGEINKDEFYASYENLKRVTQLRKLVKCSLLEIYPIKSKEINLTNFNGEQISDAITFAYENCKCRFWWVDNGSPCDEVNNLIDTCKSHDSVYY